MPIWKIVNNHPTKVAATRLQDQQLLEQHLEDWIVSDPTLLDEPLLVIGRQVLIPDTRDRLDVLAIDPQGYAVIIELKRGSLKDPVDVQALRYASYISKWQFEDFEIQARSFAQESERGEFNFNAKFETFCAEAGVDEVPNLNQDQRIILVGSGVREKLGSVALWLRSHSVDIKVIEVQAFRDGDAVLVQPTVIMPLQVSRFADTGKLRPEGAPWITDGKLWHLEKRCGAATKQILIALCSVLEDRLPVDGPHWNQKQYGLLSGWEFQLVGDCHSTGAPGT